MRAMQYGEHSGSGVPRFDSGECRARRFLAVEKTPQSACLAPLRRSRSQCIRWTGDAGHVFAARVIREVTKLYQKFQTPRRGWSGAAGSPWRARALAVCFFAAAALLVNRGHAFEPTLMRGNLGIHDPSAIIKCKNLYYIFGTGQGIISKSSSNREFWTGGPGVFANAPAWTSNAVPGFTGFFWAPDIIFHNNQYYLYYAVSTFGSQVSAIGLATNPTLDPTDPGYQWTDQGPVIQSTNGSPFNTIDPCVLQDASSNLWMSFGSYWNGIYMVQLDPATGKRLVSNQINYRLANNSSIEASYVYQHGGSYFLFVNWGTCCSGVQSTYNICMGRSSTITGPYLDRNGANLLSGGGTLFLQGTGKYIGPGQTGIFSEGGANWFTC